MPIKMSRLQFAYFLVEQMDKLLAAVLGAAMGCAIEEGLPLWVRVLGMGFLQMKADTAPA